MALVAARSTNADATALGTGTDTVINEIIATSAATPGLTPRSRSTLEKVANRGDLIVLFSDGKLAGWGVREILAPRVKEVGLMFIKPEYRCASAFSALTRELDNDASALIFATYDPALMRFVIAEHGFRPASLGEVVARSWGRFVTKRLGKASREAVAEHTAKAKPLFAFREKQ